MTYSFELFISNAGRSLKGSDSKVIWKSPWVETSACLPLRELALVAVTLEGEAQTLKEILNFCEDRYDNDAVHDKNDCKLHPLVAWLLKADGPSASSRSALGTILWPDSFHLFLMCQLC